MPVSLNPSISGVSQAGQVIGLSDGNGGLLAIEGSDTVINTVVASLTYVATTNTVWFPMPPNATKVMVGSSTASEGVRVGFGNASLSSPSANDITILSTNARALNAPRGFSLRRSGSNNCTVSLVFGT